LCLGTRESGPGLGNYHEPRGPDPEAPKQKTSADSLEDKERLLYLAEVAKRSYCRPSETSGTHRDACFTCWIAPRLKPSPRANTANFDQEENVVEW